MKLRNELGKSRAFGALIGAFTVLMALMLSGCGNAAVATKYNDGASLPALDHTMRAHLLPCIAVNLAENPTGSVNSGATINLTASATGSKNCPTTWLEYQFGVDNAGTFSVLQSWSSSTTASFAAPQTNTTLTFSLLAGAPNNTVALTSASPITVTVPPPPPVVYNAPASREPIVTNPGVAPPYTNTTYSSQVYGADCEAASLEMALSHEGIHVSQATILGDMAIQDSQAATLNGNDVADWYSPYVGYVGNPYSTHPEGSSFCTTPGYCGYGVYDNVIASIGGELGGDVTFSGTGFSPNDVYGTVAGGHPVITWMEDDSDDDFTGAEPASSWVYSSQYGGDNSSIMVIQPGQTSFHYYEHCVVVVGVNNTSVYIYNPESSVGPEWVSKSIFAASFGVLDDMAVVLN